MVSTVCAYIFGIEECGLLHHVCHPMKLGSCAPCQLACRDGNLAAFCIMQKSHVTKLFELFGSCFVHVKVAPVHAVIHSLQVLHHQQSVLGVRVLLHHKLLKDWSHAIHQPPDVLGFGSHSEQESYQTCFLHCRSC